MSLYLLSRKEVDLERWDRSVAQAPQGLPYAYSWYLDAMADQQWCALVRGDYQQVLPLPYNRKLLGMKQVYSPLVMQQTGVMGLDVGAQAVGEFLAAIPPAFRYVALHLNEGNPLPAAPGYTFSPRTNLLLDLRPGYPALWRGYDKSLRRRLRKARERLQWVAGIDPQLVVQTYRTQLETKVGLGSTTYARVEQLMRTALARGLGGTYGVYPLGGGDCQACGFFLFSHGRIIDLFGASTGAGRSSHAMHFLLDQLIEHWAGQPWCFDFEGSDLPAVARFFRSFGSQPQAYHLAVRDQRPTWLRTLQGGKNHGLSA